MSYSTAMLAKVIDGVQAPALIALRTKECKLGTERSKEREGQSEMRGRSYIPSFRSHHPRLPGCLHEVRMN